MKTILVLIITALSFTAFGQGNSVKPKEGVIPETTFKEPENTGKNYVTLPTPLKKPISQVQFEKIYSIESEIQRLLKLKTEYIEMATGVETDGYDVGFEQEKEPKAELIGYFVFKEKIALKQ